MCTTTTHAWISKCIRGRPGKIHVWARTAWFHSLTRCSMKVKLSLLYQQGSRKPWWKINFLLNLVFVWFECLNGIGKANLWRESMDQFCSLHKIHVHLLRFQWTFSFISVKGVGQSLSKDATSAKPDDEADLGRKSPHFGIPAFLKGNMPRKKIKPPLWDAAYASFVQEKGLNVNGSLK